MIEVRSYEPAHQMEQQLDRNGLGEGQVAEFVEDDEVASDWRLVCGAAPGVRHGVRPSRWLTRSTTVVEAAATGLADAGAGDGDMR